MCIRDSIARGVDMVWGDVEQFGIPAREEDWERPLEAVFEPCLLYTSDAADERSSVDLGGRRIIKKKNTEGHEMRGGYSKN